MATDFDCNDIDVGDHVIFAQSGGNGKLAKGEVLSISEKRCCIKVLTKTAVARNFKTGSRTATPDVTSRNHEHVIVILKGNRNG